MSKQPLKTTVWLVTTDDGWSAIYINGKSAYQNHGISIRDFVLAIQKAGLAEDVDFKDGFIDNEEALQKMAYLGCMPDDFSEIENDVS